MKKFLVSVSVLAALSLFFAVGCEKKEENPKADNQSPTCSITAPANNAEFYMDESISVTVVAEDSDGSIAEVQLYVDGVSHSIKAASPYNFTINAGELDFGAHTLKAIAKDNGGATGEFSVAVKIVAKGNKSPTCIITNPANDAEFNTDESIAVTVVAEDSDGVIVEVQLYVDNAGHSLKTEFPYNFTINAGELSPGTHTLRAVAKDNDGLNGESSIVVKINPPSTESPDFVSFSDGEIPNTWRTTAWVVDNTLGYDDIYSLKATSSNDEVVTDKTGSSSINYIEFYVRNGSVNLFIDGVKKECFADNTWTKYSLFLKQGLQTLIWKSSSDGVNIDAILFKSVDFSVGMPYQGGIIAYVDNTGEHGLIAAPDDQSEGLKWSNGSYFFTGAAGTAIGTGQSNTAAIVQAQGPGNYAAKLCDDLALNGYDDWFLPSIDELNELYKNRYLIGGFNLSGYYWSSSDRYYDSAWYQYFSNGYPYYHYKNMYYRVRAVRAF